MLKSVSSQLSSYKTGFNRAFNNGSVVHASKYDSNVALKPASSDQLNLSAKKYSMKTTANTISIVSFSGKPEVPQYAFKTYLTDVRTNRQNVKTLDKSNWQNDEPLLLEYTPVSRKVNKRVYISHPEYGQLGKLPMRVGTCLALMMERGYKFKVELSDIDGGKTPRSPYSLRVSIKYDIPEGKTIEDVPKEVTKFVHLLLNAKSTKKKVSIYQPPVSPEKIMNLLAPEETVDTILKEIDQAQKILLVAHTSPDGDAIGSVMGMNAVLKYLGKDTTCCIDDNLDGMYRHKLPDIDEDLKKVSEIDQNQKYDLAILMDTNTPARLGNSGQHIKNAKKVIFIDHHRLAEDRWKTVRDKTGIDVDRIKQDKLMWVKSDIPATTEMISGLIFKMIPQAARDAMPQQVKEAIAKPIAAGIKTDTECFHKGEQKHAESVAKYMMDWGNFGKKWVRDNITYNLPRRARKKVERYARQGLHIDRGIAYASIKVPYEKFMDVFNTAKKFDPDVIKSDVVNEFLFTNVFQNIRKNPRTHNDDRIAALIMERMKKEEDGKNYVSVNLRSGNGSDYARKIANVLGGGGHPTMAAYQIYNHGLNDKVYDDESNPGNKLDIEKKISQLARKFRKQAQDNTVGFAGFLKKK